MSHHARIEEVSSSSESDPSDFDPADYDPTSRFPLAPRNPSSTSSSALSPSNPTLLPSSQLPNPSSSPDAPTTIRDVSAYASHQTLYPIYFSAAHTRATGRRVPRALAVSSPLARDIASACASLGLNVLFEAGKTHPKDWCNPGRVRVLVKRDGRAVDGRVKNSECFFARLFSVTATRSRLS